MPSASLTFVSASRSSVRISYDGSGWYIPANEPEHSSGWSTVTSTEYQTSLVEDRHLGSL